MNVRGGRGAAGRAGAWSGGAQHDTDPRALVLGAREHQRLAGAVTLMIAPPLGLAAIAVVFLRWLADTARSATPGTDGP